MGIIWSLEKGKDWWGFFVLLVIWKSLYLLNKCLVYQLKEIKIKVFVVKWLADRWNLQSCVSGDLQMEFTELCE